jgi:hypothetical protein
MPVDPAQVALFIPPGLKKFKLNLFERIGKKIIAAGGRTVRHDYELLDKLPPDVYPCIGCSPQLAPLLAKWKATGRKWIGWDRGYLRRVFATWLPKAESLERSYYRWHVGSYQMGRIRECPDDRWRALGLHGYPRAWRRGGSKIVIADTLPDYWLVRGLPTNWSLLMRDKLRQETKREIVVRHKESSTPLEQELQDAWCLVTHGSIAAVEAVIMGCPVFVDAESAAATMGRIGYDDLEHPVYPERQAWLNSLAYSQFNELELVDGTLWKLME